MKEQPKPIIVLGIRSSGTSMLAGCLDIVGFDLGRNLASGRETGDPYYGRNNDIVLIHDILLRDLGCRWDMVGALPEGWLQSEAAGAAREKIKNFIALDFDKCKHWAVSDPRLCMFLPLWLEIFKEKHIAPAIGLMIRHPFEVAWSLHNGYGMDLMKGHLLWFSHNHQALSALRGQNFFLLPYDRLLADPVETLETLGGELNLELPMRPDRRRQELIAAIRPALNQKNHFNIDTRQKEREYFNHYAWLYEQLLNNPSEFAEMVAKDCRPDDNEQFARHLSPLPAIKENSAGHSLIFGSTLAVELFHDLLSFIRDREQSELDSQTAHQKLLYAADHQTPLLYARVLIPMTGSVQIYADDHCAKIFLAQEEWQKITVDIPVPEVLRENPLRFDPLNKKGIIHIRSIRILESVAGETLWSAAAPPGFTQISVHGRHLMLNCQEDLLLCATGDDLSICTPPLPNLPDIPLRFEAWMKVSQDFTELSNRWTEKEQVIKARENDIQTHLNQIDELRRTYEQADADWQKTFAEFQSRLQEKDELLKQWHERRLQWEIKEQALKARLVDQEKLTRQYFSELASSETQLVEAWHKTEQLEDQLIEVSKITQQLENDFEALLNSARWRVGNSFVRGIEIFLCRREKTLAADHMKEVFSRLIKMKKLPHRKSHRSMNNAGRARDIKLLNAWMRQLNSDYQALKNSKRWKLGNGLIRTLERLALKPPQPLATDHLDKIFQAYQAEAQGALLEDAKALQAWLRQAQKDFQALKDSKRWQTGNRVLSGVDALLFKGRQPTAMEHICSILAEFDAWNQNQV